MMQLRCGGIFINHFITNKPQNKLVKKKFKIGEYLAKIWTKVCGLLLLAQPVCDAVSVTMTIDHHK